MGAKNSSSDNSKSIAPESKLIAIGKAANGGAAFLLLNPATCPSKNWTNGRVPCSLGTVAGDPRLGERKQVCTVLSHDRMLALSDVEFEQFGILSEPAERVALYRLPESWRLFDGTQLRRVARLMCPLPLDNVSRKDSLRVAVCKDVIVQKPENASGISLVQLPYSIKVVAGDSSAAAEPASPSSAADAKQSSNAKPTPLDPFITARLPAFGVSHMCLLADGRLAVLWTSANETMQRIEVWNPQHQPSDDAKADSKQSVNASASAGAADALPAGCDFRTEEFEYDTMRVIFLSPLPDGNVAAGLQTGGCVRVLDCRAGRWSTRLPTKSDPRGLILDECLTVFSMSAPASAALQGRLVSGGSWYEGATGSKGGCLHTWNLASGLCESEVREAHYDTVSSLVQLSDGRLASCDSVSGQIKLWEPWLSKADKLELKLIRTLAKCDDLVVYKLLAVPMSPEESGEYRQRMLALLDEATGRTCPAVVIRIVIEYAFSNVDLVRF